MARDIFYGKPFVVPGFLKREMKDDSGAKTFFFNCGARGAGAITDAGTGGGGETHCHASTGYDGCDYWLDSSGRRACQRGGYSVRHPAAALSSGRADASAIANLPALARRCVGRASAGRFAIAEASARPDERAAAGCRTE